MASRRLASSTINWVTFAGRSNHRASCLALKARTYDNFGRNSSSSSGATGFDDLDKPIKFSTSQASKWEAVDTFEDKTTDRPVIQIISMWLSFFVFMVYFCILREENDVDRKLDTPLIDRIDGLEKSQLMVCYNYNLEHGLPNQAIVARLKEIEQEEQAFVKSLKKVQSS